jgi:hypothetical protein
LARIQLVIELRVDPPDADVDPGLVRVASSAG